MSSGPQKRLGFCVYLRIGLGKYLLSLLWTKLCKFTLLMPPCGQSFVIYIPYASCGRSLKFAHSTFWKFLDLVLCKRILLHPPTVYFHAKSQLRGVCYPRLRDFFNIVDLIMREGVLFHLQTVLSHCWSAQKMSETHTQTDRFYRYIVVSPIGAHILF